MYSLFWWVNLDKFFCGTYSTLKNAFYFIFLFFVQKTLFLRLLLLWSYGKKNE